MSPIYKILDLEYKDIKIKKLIKIFKRTRSKRIKQKIFNRLINMCIQEKGIIRIDDVILLRYDFYAELINRTEQLEKELKVYNDELKSH